MAQTEQGTNIITGGTGQKGRPKGPVRRFQKPLLFGLIILFLSVGIWFFIAKRKPAPIDCTKEHMTKHCLLQEASTRLAPNKVSELGKTVDDMKKNTSLSSDQDVLFVMTQYYINRSDPANARTNYDKLVIAHSQQGEFSSVLRVNNVSTDLGQLKSNIDFLDSKASYDKANFWGVKQE